MTGTYNIGLVALSFALAVVASYTALDLAGRVQSAWKGRRLFWLLGGAGAMGTGIWSMHFIAILAFGLPVPVSYNVGITLLSLLCAISGSGMTLWLLSQSVSILPLLFGGVGIGIAIAGMHYTGMAAMQLMARIEYDWRLVGLSVAIAVSASEAALWLAFRLQNASLQQWQKLGSAFMMGVAISGTHYTGMWATCFIPLQKLPAKQTPTPTFNQFWLAVAIGVATLFILSLTLLTSVFDQRLKAQLVREQALQESEKRFRMLVREMQQAEAALQRSNTRYQNLAENVPGMIYQFVLHPDGSMAFLYVSPGCRAIFGLEPEALMGNATLLWQIAHPDDVKALHQSLVDSARTLQPWDWVWRSFVFGQMRWLRGNSRPELQPDFSIIWDGLVTDITARKQAEEVLRENAERERTIARVIQQMRSSLDLEIIFSSTTQELRQAIKCDRVLVYRFNPDWSGEYVSESVAPGWNVLLQAINQADLNQTAVNKESCAVKTLSGEIKLIQDTYLQETQGGSFGQGKSYTCVSDIYKAEFDSCYLEFLERFQARAYIVVPIFCGAQLWGLLATYQNSAPRTWKVAEINMVVQIGSQFGVAIQQAELLAQTQSQAEELKKAKEAADAANHAKSNFLAHMSHELRTPLNAILGFTQLMNREQSLSEEHQQYLDIVIRSGEHLLKLINDVLEMSKIEAGRTSLNESGFDLYRLLSTLEEMLQIKACGKGLQLTFECAPDVPQYVKTDESKLSQVLLNLLGNAIKFTKQGHVNLRVSLVNSHCSLALDKGPMTSDDNGKMTIHFEVEDTGPGIAPDELKKLFEPFEQTETGLKSIEGTGLGLPISQNFVQLMGGAIAVSSQLGVGSVFRFDIQVTPVHTLFEKISQLIGRQVIGLAPRQPTYRILVAEDNPTDRLLLVKLLSSLGFDVQSAQNGQEVLAVWEYWEPHLIWMDMRMPVMDGYEVTKRIKASLKGQATVIIALTANAFESDRQNSLLAGCDDFLRKPFEREELLAKLNQHLGVQYVYKEGKEENKKNQSDIPSKTFNLQSSIKTMPDTWVEQLYSAALQCNDHLVFELLTQIPEDNSSLAVALTNLAENFQFDQIITVIQQVKTL